MSWVSSIQSHRHIKASPSSVTPLFTCNSQEIMKNNNKNNMFILGFGYVARSFAHELRTDNWKVSGTCTSTSSKDKLQHMGFDIQLFNANDTQFSCLNSLLDATHLLVSIPPVAGIGDPVLYQHQDLLKTALCNGNLQWLCYLSSTSVYGDCGGAWVDEDYPAKPTKDSANARLVAEEGWLSLGHDLGVSGQVLRLGGIYGPGRSALDTIIKQGTLTESQKSREASQYTSRIHVADICQALKASIMKPSPGRIYNVVDDEPAPRAEVFAFAETLIEKKWPGQLKEMHPSSKPALVSHENVRRGEKRVLNYRLKKELGVRLLHPTYRSGLESIIQLIGNPPHLH